MCERDRGLRADLGKATKSADVKLVLATSESMSAPNRKKGQSFCSSPSAPGGEAFRAEGAFASSLLLGTGVVESGAVGSGKVDESGKEGFSHHRSLEGNLLWLRKIRLKVSRCWGCRGRI